MFIVVFKQKKRQPSEWEKIIAKEATDIGLIFNYICSSCSSVSEKQIAQTKKKKKWAEDLNRHLFKKDIQRANKPEEKMLTVTHY